MKRLFLVLVLVIALSSCKHRTYHERTQETEIVQDSTDIKIISSEFINGIGQVVVVETNGEKFLICNNGFIEKLTH